MFWKKKTSDTPTVEYESSSRRESFRIDPADIAPVFACFGKHRVRVTDISAGGISFECESCSVGQVDTIRIDLPGIMPVSITARAEIVRLSEEIICHSRFTEIDDEAVETLHRFILHYQVTTLRDNQKSPSRKPCNHEKDD